MPLSDSNRSRFFQEVVTLGGGSGGLLEPGRLEQALRTANIPTLVAVLAHLTGEDRWFRGPYAPTRTKGLSDHPTGGLEPRAQEDIREAALATVLGLPVDWTPRTLDNDELVRIMSACMGEPVGAEYVDMMAEEMGLQARFRNERFESLPDRANYPVTIVGAGTSGICLAVQLKQAGIPFTILEKNADIGGTWFENRYPDCGVDTPSYWYSYSFNPANWPHYYSKRDDVFAYLRATVEKFGLREHIRFGVHVDEAVFDEAAATWHIGGHDADRRPLSLDSRFLVSAVGQLNQPKIPSIPGQEEFAYEQFHSAAWPAELDLRGRRVAVIGTGASAMQLVPAIAEQVESVTVFQRSPQWIAPNDEYNRTVSEDIRYLMEHVPHYAAWYRMRQVWAFGDKVYESLLIDPDWAHSDISVNAVNEGHRKYFTSYFQNQLAGRPDLIAKAVPDYPPFGKRMLLDNGWFAALKRPNVTLETSAVEQISADAVHASDGTVHDADVIVYATGFDSLNLLGSFTVRGRDGVDLRTQWGADDARAYLGITERGFPNMFMLYGPNTNLGHGGSLLFITECHVRYIMALLAQAIEKGATSLECRQEVRDEYNAQVDATHQRLIWTHPGMRTWYRNDSGRVVTNSPWRLVDIWSQTREPSLEDYEVTATWDSSAAPSAPNSRD